VSTVIERWRERAAVNIGYYVSVKSGQRAGLLYGPFTQEEDARSWIPQVIEAACEVDDRAWFYAYGTAELRTSGPLPEGKLNGRVRKVTP